MRAKNRRSRTERRLQELKWYDRTETYTRPGMALITLSLQDPCSETG